MICLTKFGAVVASLPWPVRGSDPLAAPPARHHLYDAYPISIGAGMCMVNPVPEGVPMLCLLRRSPVLQYLVLDPMFIGT